MRIDNDVKLDFSDVLIRPKRSTLTSRKTVNLERTFTFMHSGRSWTGVPVAAANMDTTGTFEMARALARHKIITALHKHYSIEELSAFFADFSSPDYVAYSLGIRDEDFEKLKAVLDAGLGDHFNFSCPRCPQRLPRTVYSEGQRTSRTMSKAHNHCRQLRNQ